MAAPSADFSCGDGTFSFIHVGGEFGAEFDVFHSTGRLDRVTREHADMFDQAPDDAYSPRIVRRPTRGIDVGTDLKATSLGKAAVLDFYGRLVEHDNERPLPFEDESFQTIYCNSAKWVRNIDSFMRETARVTRTGGLAVMHVKLAAIAGYTLAPFREMLGGRVLEILDRGRLRTWPSLASRSEWERRFSLAGFEIIEALPLATRTHAHMWDIGLRPIAPMLVRMANELKPETRLEIKQDWTALFRELLTPMCRLDFDMFSEESEPAEMQYVLRRRG